MTTLTIHTDNRVAESRPFSESSEFAWLRGKWGLSPAVGEIPRDFPDNPSGVTSVNESLRTDDVPDGQSLAVETDRGIASIRGCCHAGLGNTIAHAESVLDDEVCAVVGGTHLVAQDRPEVIETARWLLRNPSLELVAPCHCTGFEAEVVLRDELPELFVSFGVGTTPDLDSLTFATTDF